MTEPKALVGDDQPGADVVASFMALAAFRPNVADLEQVRAYLAEIRESMEQLPTVDVTDPVEHGFDPAWPEHE